jgi:5-formyltetrahydrofolate cyclo-ligase
VTDEPAAAKRALRAKLRATRADRSPERRAADDRSRSERLGELVAVLLDGLRTRSVAAYLSAGTEPDTTAIVDRLAAAGVTVLLPKSVGGGWSEPAWAVYRGADALRLGPRDIPEPVDDALPADAVGGVGPVLVPGVAGTLRGERLGRGGGWYDRALPLATGPRILLLNDDEVLDMLPTTELDQRIDVIVTPTRTIETNPGG